MHAVRSEQVNSCTLTVVVVGVEEAVTDGGLAATGGLNSLALGFSLKVLLHRKTLSQ